MISNVSVIWIKSSQYVGWLKEDTYLFISIQLCLTHTLNDDYATTK